MPRRLGLVAPFVFLFATSVGRAQDPGFDASKLGRIEATLTEAVDVGKAAGASALVSKGGKVIASFAVGAADREANRPMARDTIVRIASMSKPITSVAILRLVDEGKLSLDDSLSKFVPEFASARVTTKEEPYLAEADGPITIRHLLTHTSGLTYRFAGNEVLGPIYVSHAISDGLHETPGTIGQNVERLATIPLLFEPGTAWEYSLATDVLGRVVEVVSGLPFDRALRELVLDPLKMDDTHFVLPAAKRDRLAAVYQPGPDGKVVRTTGHPVQNGPLVYSATYPTWDDGHYFSGGAGLVSTLDDYARFLQMLLNRGELEGVRVLKPETVDAMTSNQIDELPMPDWGHGDRFGFGVAVASQSEPAPGAAAGSYSWGGFFYTYFWVDPQNDLFGILFTQTYPSGDLRLREELRRLTYEALTDPKR